MRKIITSLSVLALTLTISPAHAGDISLSSFTHSLTNDVWAVEFAPEGDELYFAENGSRTGMRRVTTTNLLSNLGAVDTATDGWAAFRLSNAGWQISDIEVSAVPGKNGHAWAYATGGNINKPASPTDAKGRTTAGVVWTMDRTTGDVEWMLTKRSSGNWQNGQMYQLTQTPDGRYIYAFGYGTGVDEGSEIFKYSTLTNTQVGRGVATEGSYPVADDTNVYTVTSSGIYKIVIDGDNSQSNGDSLKSLMSITWTSTPFDFTKYSSVYINNGELFIPGINGTIAVVNPTTGTGTTYTISGGGSLSVLYGVRVGIDGCFYSVATNSSWNQYAIQKINPRTSSVVDVTNTQTNFQPHWEESVDMNAAKTIYVVSPKKAASGSLKYISISGSACGGVTTYAAGVSSSSSSSSSSTTNADEIRRELEAKRSAEVAKAKESITKKVASGTTLSISDLKEAEFGTPSQTSILEINKVLEKMPMEQRQNLNTVAEVVKKYVTYDVLTAERPGQITSSHLVNVGIMPKELPNKTVILKTILNTPATDRDSIDEINQIIKIAGDKLLARQQRIKELLARSR